MSGAEALCGSLLSTTTVTRSVTHGLADSTQIIAIVRFFVSDDVFDNQVTYRGTAAYLVEEWGGTRFHGSAARGVKNPTLTELFGLFPNFTGNPNLEPEEGFGWDIGVEQPLFDEMVLVDVTYFNNKIKNLITGAGNTAINLPGESKIQGVEFSASARPFDDLTLTAAYTYTDGKDPNGQELVRRAKNIASLVANYEFELADRPATLNLGLQCNGEQDDINFVRFFPLTTETVTLDSYTLLNLRASWQISSNVEIFARGENLLDEQYQEVFGFGTPGIAGYGGIRVRFGS